MRPAALNFPPNPAYGTGSCRRTIGLVARNGIVDGHLSDDFHEMRCRVRHDGRTVLAVEGNVLRIPTTACPAAIGVLQELVGIPLATPVRDFYRGARARRHCTHLLDLAVLAVRHGAAPPHATHYEAIVPDETDEPVTISVARDGAVVHRWRIGDGIILSPEPLQGNTLYTGFAAWAAGVFDDDELEAATVLSRTWLIAIGRRFLPQQAAGRTIAENAEMAGRCFAYAPERAATATFTGN